MVQNLARHRSVETTRGYLGDVADPKGVAVEARERLVWEHLAESKVRVLQQADNRSRSDAPKT